MRFSSTSWLLFCAVTASGCFISEGIAPEPQPCAVDEDCPSTHRCVPLAEGGHGCELRYPPLPQEFDAGRPATSLDGGSADAGPLLTPTWCKDIQPVMAASCVSTCHGETTTGSGRSDFRLDVYSSTTPLGAREKADRIKVRAVEQKTMPPASRPALSASDRELLERWVAAGTPSCDDAGTP